MKLNESKNRLISVNCNSVGAGIKQETGKRNFIQDNWNLSDNPAREHQPYPQNGDKIQYLNTKNLIPNFSRQS